MKLRQNFVQTNQNFIHLQKFSSKLIDSVKATGEHREANWFCQNFAIAVQRGNEFSILSVCRERS